MQKHGHHASHHIFQSRADNQTRSRQKTQAFFEGWYLKHQSAWHTLILIPAWHVDTAGASYGTLQIILDDKVHMLRFAASECYVAEDRFHVRLGQNVFSEKGCRLHLDLPMSNKGTPDVSASAGPSHELPPLTIRGHLYYGKLHAPLRSFMGPFAHLPLPCFHQVLSLSHRLRGHVQVGDELWDFQDGTGYIEKDWGYEFPAHYLWIQGNSTDSSETADTSNASFMLTIADLSSPHRRFLACSSLLRYDGKQYRLSTYQGARLNRYGSRRIDLRQGPYKLQIILPPEPTAAVELQAPKAGDMNRVIEEHPRCPIRCQLYCGKKLIFDQESAWGSYELA